jgi:hypothetical protein
MALQEDATKEIVSSNSSSLQVPGCKVRSENHKDNLGASIWSSSAQAFETHQEGFTQVFTLLAK